MDTFRVSGSACSARCGKHECWVEMLLSEDAATSTSTEQILRK